MDYQKKKGTNNKYIEKKLEYIRRKGIEASTKSLLLKLWAEGFSDYKIAAILSKRTGTKITDGDIKERKVNINLELKQKEFRRKEWEKEKKKKEASAKPNRQQQRFYGNIEGD